ncbi:MAG TPA: helix-turn-helix transcriptional regulator [Bacilli bacterium]|nr:helix-turn-helix transcriptional regulator [Bacilli bacterium]
MKESFGARLARIRKSKGMTQEEVADKLHVSSQAVSKWENDASYPDIDGLLALADLFDVTVDELVGKSKETPRLVPQEERKDIKNMVVRILVNSKDGDKVRVNVPVALVKIMVESNALPQINGNETLKNIDFKQVLDLIEQGVIGKLVEVDSADGDHVEIVVE